MKTMTCKQLGGACDMQFHAETFEEIAELSKSHGLEMAMEGDEDHINAMNIMQDLMRTPEAIKAWYEDRRKVFESMPL